MSYIAFQIDTYGNVLAPDGHTTIDVLESDYEVIEDENGLKNEEELKDWFDIQAELELIDKENN